MYQLHWVTHCKSSLLHTSYSEKADDCIHSVIQNSHKSTSFVDYSSIAQLTLKTMLPLIWSRPPSMVNINIMLTCRLVWSLFLQVAWTMEVQRSKHANLISYCYFKCKIIILMEIAVLFYRYKICHIKII